MADDGSADRVTAVVVTRDRRELLRACLTALRAQTHPLARLVVVDNASSDGTPALVRAEFGEAQLLALRDNVGAAGGFHAGLAAALEGGDADWLWTLDDDTIARPDALERLLRAPWAAAGLPEPAVLASRVDWTDGEPHPMNTPILRRRDPDALVAAAAAGLLALRSSTFVSLLVRPGAVRRHGLPRADFFFQADDVEFTARLLRHEVGYLVPDSVVEHRTPTAHTFLDDPVRFRFHLRNTVRMARGDAWSRAERAALGWVALDSSARFVRARGVGAAAGSLGVVAGAVRDGLRG